MPLVVKPAPRRPWWRQRMSEQTRVVVIALALILFAMWIVVIQQQALKLQREVGVAADRVANMEASLNHVETALPAAAGAAR